VISTYLVKKHLLFILILPFILFSTACTGENDDIPDFTLSNTGPYMLNMSHLEILKSKMDDPFIEAELSKLKLLADEALINDFEYVTDKANLPPSGDRNDYMSLARYLWPDPSTGDYTVIRDGITNPKIYQYDRPKLDRISTEIFYLSLAYYYFENEDYARKATELISNWFLEEDTKMNPNLNYAQVALGVNNNRGNPQGIIDTNDFIKVIDAISLIYDSRHWTTSKHKELKAWFYSFSRWIDSNYNANAFCDIGWCNNVSTWIDAQKTIYFLFTEQEDRLNSASSIQPIRDKISLQFSSNGIQRDESTRTLSQHYFYFNLRGYMKIAAMRKQRTGYDRDWTILNSPDIGGIKPSLDAIVKHLNGEDTSNFFNQANGFNNCRYLEIFRPAAIIFDHQEYEDIANQLLYHQCSNLNITLTMPPLEWIGTEEPENSTLF
jgi:hypothetical protein